MLITFVFLGSWSRACSGSCQEQLGSAVWVRLRHTAFGSENIALNHWDVHCRLRNDFSGMEWLGTKTLQIPLYLYNEINYIL